MYNASLEPEIAKAAAEKAAAARDEQPIKGTTPADSLLRIAHALRAAAVWGHPSLAAGAVAFEEEAQFLSPAHEVIATKENLEKQIAASRASIDKAAAVLANPSATQNEHTVALKDLQTPAIQRTAPPVSKRLE